MIKISIIVIVMFGTHLLLMSKAIYNGKTYVTSDESIEMEDEING